MFNSTLAKRSFAWRPKQQPFRNWTIVRGDQVSDQLVLLKIWRRWK